MSIYDQRESSAYRGDFRTYRNRNYDKWWSADHDQLLARLIEKYQWNWYWAVSEHTDAITPTPIFEVLVQQKNWQNNVMYYAITRANDLGLTKNIRAPTRKVCPLCGEIFTEDSLPFPLVRRLGIDRLTIVRHA